MVDRLYTNIDIREVEKALTGLPRAMQRRVYRKTVRAGAIPVRDAARANIRSEYKEFSGLASRASSVATYNLKNFRGYMRVAIQIRRGLVNAVKRDKDGNPVRVGMYMAVGEYGSSKLNRRPRSWIRKAQRESGTAVVNAMQKELNLRLEDALKDVRQ